MYQLDLSRRHLTNIDLPESPELTHLDMSYNQIKSTQGIETCYGLQVLDLSYNQLTYIESWCCLSNLLHVCLSHNRLKTTFGLRHCFKLQTLDISFNNLSVVEGLEGLQELHSLDLSHNSLKEVGNSIRVLSLNAKLKVLSLEGNLLRNYRQVCCSMLPGLLELDGVATPPSSVCRSRDKLRSGYARSKTSRQIQKPNVKPHYMLPKTDQPRTPYKSPSRFEKPTPKVGITMLTIHSPPELTPLKRSPFQKLSDSEVSLSSDTSEELQTYTFGSEEQLSDLFP
mmetsp:Transcript_11464/g.22515  ORF Transcript_11464/g.22515 Transcript_11464/m.22515 type:complete len:283 (-) Transcript_11464:1381-2229(-)